MNDQPRLDPFGEPLDSGDEAAFWLASGPVETDPAPVETDCRQCPQPAQIW